LFLNHFYNLEKSPRYTTVVLLLVSALDFVFLAITALAGLCPHPLWELERSPRPHSRKTRGLLLRGGEEKEGKGITWKGEEGRGQERRGGEGRGKKERQGRGRVREMAP